MIYKILETRQAVQYWTYEVEANSKEEAILLVQDGEVEPIDYTIDTDDFQGDEDNIYCCIQD